MSKTEKKEDTMISTEEDGTVDQGCSTVGSDRRAEAVDVSEVRVGGPARYTLFMGISNSRDRWSDEYLRGVGINAGKSLHMGLVAPGCTDNTRVD